MQSETAIANLLYRYAECIDRGDLTAAAKLFTHAKVRRKVQEAEVFLDSVQIEEFWRKEIILYPDGTPRTKHVITNPIIEVDEEKNAATCRSYYTVLQQTPDLPLQIVCSGRYEDRFERVDGQWRFSFRNYALLDFVGDISQHVYGRRASRRETLPE